MTNSFIIIKGCHINRIADIFDCFMYKDLKQDVIFNNIVDFNHFLNENYLEYANRNISLRGIWTDNDWTLISDPEIVDILEEEALLKLSNKLNTIVLTFVIQTTSRSFAFAKYDKVKERHFFSIENSLIENFGSQLIEELDVNLNDNVVLDDILKLSTKFGIDLEGGSNKSFIVKKLEYIDVIEKKLDFSEQEKGKKTWWKFWKNTHTY